MTGLTIGQTYTLSFYQGASQQVGFDGATTNQWIVSLGTSGLYVASSGNPSVENTNCGTNCIYVNSDATASIAASTLMNVPNHGVVGWNYVSVDLTADATTDLLSFLAWGDNGNTTNLPPIAFLAGVELRTWAGRGRAGAGQPVPARRRPRRCRGGRPPPQEGRESLIRCWTTGAWAGHDPAQAPDLGRPSLSQSEPPSCSHSCATIIC